jgi:TonB family protein
VSAPVVLYKTESEYSEVARKLNAKGTVALYIEVQPDGTAGNIRVLRSLGYGLEERAIEAVRKWRFRPGTKDGKAVVVRANIEVNFRGLGKVTDWCSQEMAFPSEAGLAPPVVTDGTLPNVRTASQTASSRPRPTILIPDTLNEHVVLEFTVDLGRSVKNVHVIDGSESSSELLSRYLATWKFQPAVKNNRSVEAIGKVSFVREQGDEPTKVAPETTALQVDSGQIRTMANPKEGDSKAPLPQTQSIQSVQSLAAVRAIFVDSLGQSELSIIIRDKIINRLVASGRFQVVLDPDKARCGVDGRREQRL